MSEIDQSLSYLKTVIAKLRDPKDGCPWDLEQTHQSLKPYLIEESYETLSAIDEADWRKLCDELGDVLLQIMLHSQLASERGEFTVTDVIKSITDKIIRRHPHIFKDTKVSSSKEVLQNWERIKQTERAGDQSGKKGALDSVPRSLPALLKAQRMGEKAARLGFDWKDAEGVERKIEEELREFLEADQSFKAEEFGDLLFSLAQLGRKLGYNCETELSQASEKFRARFQVLESLAQSRDLKGMSEAELEELWSKAKAKIQEARANKPQGS